MDLLVNNIDQLADNVKLFLPFLKKSKLFLLNGEMGVGKTTFVQEVLKQMEIHDLNGSPTYSIINSYESEAYGKIFHLDLYRLKAVEELFDIGIEEILNEDAYLFVEWPDLLLPFLKDSYFQLNFKLSANLERKINVFFHE